MTYFKTCKTLDELKSAYKFLAKVHHPDCGGDTATMQAINDEYSTACAAILSGQGLADDETAKQTKLSEEYRKVIEQIINLPGIVIELVGHWIWVTGNTRSVKGQLKAAGLLFANKKVAWYYWSEEHKTRGTGKDLDEVRSKYGSEKVDKEVKTFVLQQQAFGKI